MTPDPSKTFFFFFLQTFRLFCFLDNFCFITQPYFIFSSQTDGKTFCNYVLVEKIHGSFNNGNYPGLEEAKYLHIVTLPPAWYDFHIVKCCLKMPKMLATLPWMPVLANLFLNVESWLVTLSEATEPCRFFFFLESFMTSYRICHFSLGEMLAGW